MEKLQPIHFQIKMDSTKGRHVYDQYFVAILCSPKFEGKNYREINAMFEEHMESIGMESRVRCHMQPPSRYEKMKIFARWYWRIGI